MRERSQSDWVIDLAGRHELETRVARALDSSTALRLLGVHTSRFDRLDYTVATGRVPASHVELKAKWQLLSWVEQAPSRC